jgi:two-component system, cell cycle sensor histidine kinase and response regulator CckA
MSERASARVRPTILLVEDESAVRSLLAGVLSRKFQVLQAENGLAALEIFAHHREEITLLLTDIAMPELDGIALAERIIGEKPDLKVVFLSAYYREDERTLRLADAGAAFLAKPFSPAALLARIEKIIAGRAELRNKRPSDPLRWRQAV